MNANAQLQTVFHLTGRPPAAPLQAISKLGLRPAMLARWSGAAGGRPVR